MSLRADLWRAVEAQHLISTMRLVDSVAEQDLLERLLEQSKPPLPATVDRQAYLLNTPFRYRSPWASRFRRVGELGIWYGAERIETACAEVGYWRWRFLTDSEGLREQSLYVEFTVFRARVDGDAVDLTQPPWNRARELWMDPTDYSACQHLAGNARQRGVRWIRYASVRDPAHGLCGAVLDARALSLSGYTSQQTWAARVHATAVAFSHGQQRLEFDATGWKDAA